MALSFRVFNDLLRDFLDQLAEQFPGNPDVGLIKLAMGLMDEKKPAQLFVEELQGKEAKVLARDPTLFQEVRIGSLDLAGLWRDTANPQTRAVIFDHVHNLYLLGKHLMRSDPGAV